MICGDLNMATISTNQVVTDLAAVLGRVARGEEFTILSGDQPVARIVPVELFAGNGGGLTPHEAIEQLRIFGKGHFLGDINIKDLIEEGRM